MKKKKRTVRVQDKSTVAAYEHFVELRDCLASGWPSTTTREYLIEKHGPEGVPSEVAIQRWRNKYMTGSAMVLPPTIIQQKLKGIDFKVDVIGHLSRLVALCEDRVGRGIASEEKDFGGMPVPGNDGVMQTYLHALAQYVEVAQDLGIMKSRPQAPLIDARTMNVTPEALIQLRETVREIRMIEAGGGLNDKPRRAKAGNKRNDKKTSIVPIVEGRVVG